jgi:hypothetical protein
MATCRLGNLEDGSAVCIQERGRKELGGRREEPDPAVLVGGETIRSIGCGTNFTWKQSLRQVHVPVVLKKCIR